MQNKQVFLDKDDLIRLTGFKVKSKQAMQLRKMKIAFLTNARSEPLVFRSYFEKVEQTGSPEVEWQSNALKAKQNARAPKPSSNAQ